MEVMVSTGVSFEFFENPAVQKSYRKLKHDIQFPSASTFARKYERYAVEAKADIKARLDLHAGQVAVAIDA